MTAAPFTLAGRALDLPARTATIRRMKNRVVGLSLVAALAAGCGSEPGAGTLPAGDPFDPAALSPLLAAATCDYRDACEPVFSSFLPQTHADCVAEVTADVRASYDALATLTAASPPRVAFLRANFDRCLAAYRAAQSDCDLGIDETACAAIFAGATAIGKPCSASQECAPGGACVSEDTASCKTCRAVAPVGGDCKSTVCAPGATCLAVGNAIRCVASNLRLGSACGTVETGLCAGRLLCVGSTTLTCQRPGTLGATCDAIGASAPECSLYRGLGCDGTKHCVALTIGTAGAACGMNAPTTLCRSDLYCDTVSYRCQPLPAAGAPCPGGACAKGAFCDKGTCQAERAAGQSCTASRQCSGRDVCQDSVCGALHFKATCG